MEFLDKTSIKNKKGYASNDLRDQVIERLENQGHDAPCLHAAYTHHGGTFMDKVLVEFLDDNYSDDDFLYEATSLGGNLFYFFNTPEEYEECKARYHKRILDIFPDFGDYYCQHERELITGSYHDFLSCETFIAIEDMTEESYQQGLAIFKENGTLLASGIDYNPQDMVRRFEEAGII